MPGGDADGGGWARSRGCSADNRNQAVRIPVEFDAVTARPLGEPPGLTGRILREWQAAGGILVSRRPARRASSAVPRRQRGPLDRDAPRRSRSCPRADGGRLRAARSCRPSTTIVGDLGGNPGGRAAARARGGRATVTIATSGVRRLARLRCGCLPERLAGVSPSGSRRSFGEIEILVSASRRSAADGGIRRSLEARGTPIGPERPPDRRAGALTVRAGPFSAGRRGP